jgi:hypothetical protein
MRQQPDPPARLIAGLPAAIVTCACLAVTGCGGAPASDGAATGSSGHVTRPAATSSSPQAPAALGTAPGPVHLTGNFCSDVAAINSRIRAITDSIVTNPSGRQQRARKLFADMVSAFTALGSEAPAQLKAPFAKLTGFYQAVGNKLASGGGQLTLASIEPYLHPTEASAARQLNSYFFAHCGPA